MSISAYTKTYKISKMNMCNKDKKNKLCINCEEKHF